MSHLNQKERMLLQDQKGHEEICIKKYNDYANKAQDPKLKQIFSSLGQQEQQHLNTINQIMNGQVPNLSLQGQQNQQNQQAQTGMNIQNTQGMQNKTALNKDADLCTDMLMTEKYVSGAYDTAIFEFRDANIRQAMNHIQKEEQQHGEQIFNYMQSNGMYNMQ